jgi:hypothetical protein
VTIGNAPVLTSATRILILNRVTASSIDFGLELLAPLSAIEEAKQDFQPLRQLLGVVKFGATVLSGEQHLAGGDAHRRLRDLSPRLIDDSGRLLVPGR